MNLSELIEKRYELLKEKSRLQITIEDCKLEMARLRVDAVLSGVADGGKNEKIRDAILDNYLDNNGAYKGYSDTREQATIEFVKLQPEIAYIEDLIELAKLEMKNV